MTTPDGRLSELAQSLVEAGRDADQPSPEQRERMRYRLMGLLGASSLAGASTKAAAASAGSSAPGAAATSGAAAAKGGGLFSALSTAKLLTVLAATGTGVGAAVMVFEATVKVAPPAQLANDVDARPPSAVVAETTVAAEQDAEPQADALAFDLDEVAPAPRARAAQPARQAQRSPRAERRSERLPTLQQELALIGAAQVQLRNGNPAAALAILERHAKRYPRGALRQESIAARAIALCEIGRVPEGRKLARALRRDAPSSPLAPRVERACSGATNDSP